MAISVENRYDPLVGGNPSPLTGAGTNTWLVDGAEPALIDAGVGASIHIEAIARALGGRALAQVLVTHGHPDHASGIAALRARWPALSAAKFLRSGETGWRPLRDGERVRAGDQELHVMHTPGHAVDHVCFWNADTRDLYSGDMVFLGTSAFVAPVRAGGNLRAYLASLERMLALDPVRLLPGHGPIIDHPREVISQYLAHRQEREAQVIDCLKDGFQDLDAIVQRIYPDLADGLRRAARLMIEAHLEKLRDDGYALPMSLLAERDNDGNDGR